MEQAKTRISASVVADSINEYGNRITTVLATMPRIVLAELNTHRMLSKNSASSRAIPTTKMLQIIQETPFIPIAWQKEHKGMQGTEYMDKEFAAYQQFIWLKQRDEAVKNASMLLENKVTKQLANRLLEPFMYHTVLITATEWQNFFNLRCPQYDVADIIYKSKKDVYKEYRPISKGGDSGILDEDDFNWFYLNKGQAEIHMMATAETIHDAMNESKPRELKAGEWHIPYEDKILNLLPNDIWNKKSNIIDTPLIDAKIRISTAMAARTSYTTVGDEKEISYETLIGIHDKMVASRPLHASPMEHCAMAMSKDDLDNFIRMEGGKVIGSYCRNFQGFIQYRYFLEQAGTI